MKDFSNKIYTEGLIIPLMEISLKFLEKISIFYVIRLLFGEKQQNPPKEEIPEPKLVDATSQEKKKFVQTALFVDIWIFFNYCKNKHLLLRSRKVFYKWLHIIFYSMKIRRHFFQFVYYKFKLSSVFSWPFSLLRVSPLYCRNQNHKIIERSSHTT